MRALAIAWWDPTARIVPQSFSSHWKTCSDDEQTSRNLKTAKNNLLFLGQTRCAVRFQLEQHRVGIAQVHKRRAVAHFQHQHAQRPHVDLQAVLLAARHHFWRRQVGGANLDQTMSTRRATAGGVG